MLPSRFTISGCFSWINAFLLEAILFEGHNTVHLFNITIFTSHFLIWSMVLRFSRMISCHRPGNIFTTARDNLFKEISLCLRNELHIEICSGRFFLLLWKSHVKVNDITNLIQMINTIWFYNLSVMTTSHVSKMN